QARALAPVVHLLGPLGDGEVALGRLLQAEAGLAGVPLAAPDVFDPGDRGPLGPGPGRVVLAVLGAGVGEERLAFGLRLRRGPGLGRRRGGRAGRRGARAPGRPRAPPPARPGPGRPAGPSTRRRRSRSRRGATGPRSTSRRGWPSSRVLRSPAQPPPPGPPRP